MAQVITLNVYEINGEALPTPYSKLFPAAQLSSSPYNGNNQNLYTVLQDNQGFLFAVVERVSAIKLLANA